LVLCKVLEPNKHFNWQIGSRICDGFIGYHNRHWDFPLDRETTRVGLRLSVLITIQTPYTTLVFQKKKGVTLSEPYWMLDIAAVRLDRNLNNTCGERLLTARSVIVMGVIAWAVGVCRKIWVCVLIPEHNFYSTLCLFWRALPYIVCHCMSLAVVSCLRQCHCRVQVFCEELRICSVSSGNTEQALHSDCL
jgi:hypothetical protein